MPGPWPLQGPPGRRGATGGPTRTGIGACLATSHAGRRLAAAERAETEVVLDELTALLAELTKPQQ